MSERRKLAAILAADVVGYSRLAGSDEDRTLARLRALRSDLIDPTIAVHTGRVVKRTGDGTLVEFRSVVDAVRCAIEVQNAMLVRNAGVPPDRRIEFRIGIHIGDIVEESDGDLMGDGINIAARLEGLAKPNGICLSGSAYEQVREKFKEQFVDLGEQTLKNIARPVRAYQMLSGAAFTEPEVARGRLVQQDKPSIAVLPFQNMSGDVEQQYLCDGLTEDLITELSRFRQMQVASRNSSSRFRGADVDMIRAGRELCVQYLVEGSVRRMGTRIRITAQLIDATTGNHVWAERYDSAQDEIFDIQDRVVRTTVGTLVGRMTAARTDLVLRKPPASLAAYQCVLRGDALPMGTPEIEAEARHYFERAIELDPSYARAYALLSSAIEREWFLDMSGSTRLLDEAFEMARKAVALDENDHLCQLVMAWTQVDRGAYEVGEQHFAKAISLNPNHPVNHTDLAMFYNYRGETEKAIEGMLEAKRLDPFFNPSWYWGELAAVYFNARRYDDAIANMRRSSSLSFSKQVWFAASYAMAGKPDLAGDCVAGLLRRVPDFSTARYVAKEPLFRIEDRQHLAEGMRKAGLPE
ncbi:MULTISPECIES: adenylate/guanylate cyclase domain-containing protein [unclassified Mesorhizobium]|uniref:adenylate/guanylate cyclase domain-containing protein n=1 Tax=unclassified Mesorhizobium TaxID=325217 RepID=UPI001092EE70|nr:MULTISPECIES: adenylate/guanylate cyclase domain-containing protein [unclassified Mesorhizobium]TGQ37129.1 hypothetical protein EN857_16355 [Mesorhizobium sp. M4B.F.Ca.ET.214.01.1.1]TGQ59423.1 hypothetical protein EN854_19085 [Mesorhizobium sp. M4B.F.Ca.ET.211.01.1.1]TGU34148.1 hypothetical protein EN793_19075 [Mesorhizobium sp. M4B.F.Ca.ET.150.01.1.1]